MKSKISNKELILISIVMLFSIVVAVINIVGAFNVIKHAGLDSSSAVYIVYAVLSISIVIDMYVSFVCIKNGLLRKLQDICKEKCSQEDQIHKIEDRLRTTWTAEPNLDAVANDIIMLKTELRCKLSAKPDTAFMINTILPGLGLFSIVKNMDDTKRIWTYMGIMMVYTVGQLCINRMEKRYIFIEEIVNKIEKNIEQRKEEQQ